jgi:hypothetical protein
MSIEAMKQALEALEEAHPKPYNESVISHVEAITALRTAIEAAEKQEPVAWDVFELRLYGAPQEKQHRVLWVDRYTHPDGSTPDLDGLLESAKEDGGIDGGAKTLYVRPLYTTPPAQPATVQEAVAWPCLIEEADFSQNTVTLAMQCEDYKVSAGKHWLYTTPPAAQPAPVQQSRSDVEPNEANDLIRNLGFDPEQFRTDAGFMNHMKLRAAIQHPEEYPAYSSLKLKWCHVCGLPNPDKGLCNHEAAKPAPVQEPFSPEAISATQRAWQMGYEAAKAEMQPEQEPAGSFMSREMAIEFCRRRRPSIEPTEQHIDRTIDAYAALFGDLVPTPPAAQPAPVLEPVPDEDELSNGLAFALHDAVLIRIGNDDEATRQAIARIDKLVAKYVIRNRSRPRH